jgi:hypothetical protein
MPAQLGACQTDEKKAYQSEPNHHCIILSLAVAFIEEAYLVLIKLGDLHHSSYLTSTELYSSALPFPLSLTTITRIPRPSKFLAVKGVMPLSPPVRNQLHGLQIRKNWMLWSNV